MSDMQILDQLDIIAIEVTIPTGKRKLAAEDLKLTSTVPEALIQLGTKQTIDPSDLKTFYTLKRRAERYCDAVGIRFLSGYAVPQYLTAGIIESIEKTRVEFEAEKSKFLTTYDQKVNSWISKHPDFAASLRRAVWTNSEISARLSFGHASFRMKASDHPGQLGTMVSRLGNTLLDEVATDAEELLERSIVPIQKGEAKLTRRILSPLQRIRDKLNGLAFVDPAVSPVVDAIDALLKKAGTDGDLAPLLQDIIQMTLVLSDPDKMRRIGSVLVPASPTQGEIGFLGLPLDTAENDQAAPPATETNETAADLDDPDVDFFASLLSGEEPAAEEAGEEGKEETDLPPAAETVPEKSPAPEAPAQSADETSTGGEPDADDLGADDMMF